MEKLDYKKAYKDLYLPKKIVSEVCVPNIRFVRVKGKGLPGTPAFQNAISLLYSFAFSIKMSKMKHQEPEGYFEYVMPPLEALWGNGELEFDYENQKTWVWEMMIRLPEFVNEDIFETTREFLRMKHPELPVDKASIFEFTEGHAVQIMHIGDYESERTSAALLQNYMKAHNYYKNGKHHEIYLSDPRRTKPEKLKTVIRIPIK